MEKEFFNWSEKKNLILKTERDVAFEDVILAINEDRLLGIVEHSSEKYKGQKIFIIEINEYAYLVPFVRNKNEIFLKTIIPSRKATKKYLN